MPPTENNLLKDLLSRLAILWITQRNIVIMTVVGFVIILAALILSVFGNHARTAQNTSPANSNTLAPPSQKQNVSNNTYPAPSVFFEKYINNSSTPTAYSKLVNGVTVYSFKSGFSDNEVKSFAKFLGLTDIKNTASSADYVIAYNFSNTSYDENPKLANDRGILTFNRLTGSFDYQSYGVKIASDYRKGQDAKVNTLNFLKELKVADASLSCNITYQRKELPDATFVECHRNWEEIGLPIYNFIGILNVSDSIKLSSLKLGSVDSLSPEDKTVSDVTIDGVKVTSADGKARPNDFNTVTVAINNTDGRILSVSSNLRWIESLKKETLSNLLTPEQALDQFINHKSDLSLTIPAGSGTIDWGKVYQDNIAHSKEAVITEYILSYLENPPSVKQSFLAPMYTIRGYTTLDTGFRVNFIQTVPALKDKTSFLTQAEIDKKVLGTSTQLAEADDSQSAIKVGVYNPPSSSPQPNPTPSRNPSANQPENGDANYFQICNSITSIIGDKIYLGKDGSTGQDVYASNTASFSLPGFFGARTIKFVFGTGPGNNYHSVYLGESIPTPDMGPIRALAWGMFEEQYAWNVIDAVNEYHLVWPITTEGMFDLFKQIRSKRSVVTAPPDESYFNLYPVLRQVRINVATILLLNHSTNHYRNLLPPSVNDSNFPAVFNVWFPGGGLTEARCFITGGTTSASPTLILYSKNSIELLLSISPEQTYSDPISINSLWSGSVNPSGLFIHTNSNIPYDYLYYEYDPSKVSFNKPTTGFSVKYSDWQQTVENISDKYGLNQKEKDRLVLEVKNELFNKPVSNYLTITIIDPKELDSKLPLTISPTPNSIHRIHLALTPSDTYQTLSQPSINPINRPDFYAVEVGARLDKL